MYLSLFSSLNPATDTLPFPLLLNLRETVSSLVACVVIDIRFQSPVVKTISSVLFPKDNDTSPNVSFLIQIEKVYVTPAFTG